ncbi:hypothetical protein [Tumebacillus permanentifrigoris]|uniref:Uncharacterized protein n=1 Tax=Tumebacillus permanentifrigoris TaxID=378543 RepID=A0A316DCP2_9BACL|nr:hypothetical protein [Tumebacillus permanentifrigoris]PWK15937.1 hypothetical protein C7459_102183 [Tumebacillus permanentifrigoris]
MDEKNLPTWLLVAVVVGLGEVSYYLWKHYGFGLGTKTAVAVTGLAAIATGIIYLSRTVKSKAVKK